MRLNNLLIIHPEGNINSNPNLTSFVEILCEKGFNIDIISPKRDIHQKSPCEYADLFLYNSGKKYYHTKNFPFFFKALSIGYPNSIIRKIFFELIQSDKKYNKTLFTRERFIKLISIFKFQKFFLKSFFLCYLNKYKLIIGVDRDGIIEAAFLSKIISVPYALLSYEIFFLNETDINFKQKEILACKNISFAICQDSIRSSLLSKENQIDSSIIKIMPVAGRGIKERIRDYYFHDLFDISYEKKIAFFMGSVSEWTMIDELISSVSNWPDNWVLVIHDRYGKGKLYTDSSEDILNSRIYFSQQLFPTFIELKKALMSVELGIALYRATFTSIYSGKNLAHIGLASGKIATYLQHGIPVLTNVNGVMADLIKEYNAGFIVENIEEIPLIYNSYNFDGCEQRCHSLFKEHLDMNLYIDEIIGIIDNIGR